MILKYVKDLPQGVLQIFRQSYHLGRLDRDPRDPKWSLAQQAAVGDW